MKTVCHMKTETDMIARHIPSSQTFGIGVGNVLFRKPVNVLLHELILCTVGQFDCVCRTERWTHWQTTANVSHIREDGKRPEGRNNTRLRPFTTWSDSYRFRTAALWWEARWQQEGSQWILIIFKFKDDESYFQSFHGFMQLPSLTLSLDMHLAES